MGELEGAWLKNFKKAVASFGSIREWTWVGQRGHLIITSNYCMSASVQISSHKIRMPVLSQLCILIFFAKKRNLQ